MYLVDGAGRLAVCMLLRRERMIFSGRRLEENKID